MSSPARARSHPALAHRAAACATGLACATAAFSLLGAVPASASTTGDAVIAEAASLAGSPYAWGGDSPSGFDCSGFTRYVYAHLGVLLPRTAQEQYDAVTHVPRSDARPGDLIFFTDSSGHVYHDGIYAGDDTMWDAAHSGTVVARRHIWTTHYQVGRVGGSTSSPSATTVTYHRPAAGDYPLPSASSQATVRLGSRGPAVMSVQRLLGVTADGDFGPHTAAAVVAFQRAHGLATDGVVGPHTWAALTGEASTPTVVTVSAPSTSTDRPTLRQGSTGPSVARLQRLLGVTADGDFGPHTAAAVIAFQHRVGLTADSIVGPLTWAALLNPTAV